MSGQVPPMFWFVFWVGLSVGVLSFGFFMAIIIHRGNMKALDVLKSYAEKGLDPPPAILEMLTRHLGNDDAAKAGRAAGRRAGNFVGQVIAACAAGGIAWWRLNAGGPELAVYFFGFTALFFGVQAITYLVNFRATSEK